jgi:hypothetical protein
MLALGTCGPGLGEIGDDYSRQRIFGCHNRHPFERGCRQSGKQVLSQPALVVHENKSHLPQIHQKPRGRGHVEGVEAYFHPVPEILGAGSRSYLEDHPVMVRSDRHVGSIEVGLAQPLVGDRRSRHAPQHRCVRRPPGVAAISDHRCPAIEMALSEELVRT